MNASKTLKSFSKIYNQKITEMRRKASPNNLQKAKNILIEIEKKIKKQGIKVKKGNNLKNKWIKLEEKGFFYTLLTNLDVLCKERIEIIEKNKTYKHLTSLINFYQLKRDVQQCMKKYLEFPDKIISNNQFFYTNDITGKRTRMLTNKDFETYLEKSLEEINNKIASLQKEKVNMCAKEPSNNKVKKQVKTSTNSSTKQNLKVLSKKPQGKIATHKEKEIKIPTTEPANDKIKKGVEISTSNSLKKPLKKSLKESEGKSIRSKEQEIKKYKKTLSNTLNIIIKFCKDKKEFYNNIFVKKRDTPSDIKPIPPEDTSHLLEKHVFYKTYSLQDQINLLIYIFKIKARKLEELDPSLTLTSEKLKKTLCQNDKTKGDYFSAIIQPVEKKKEKDLSTQNPTLSKKPTP